MYVFLIFKHVIIVVKKIYFQIRYFFSVSLLRSDFLLYHPICVNLFET